MGFKNNIRSKITISFTTTKKDDVPETTENITTGNKTNAKKALKKTKICFCRIVSFEINKS